MNRIIILVIFLSFTTSLQAQSVESDELFSKGVELYNLKRYNEAISYFNKSNNIDKAQLDTTNSRRYYSEMWLSSCYMQLGKIKEAQAISPDYYMVPPIDRRLTVESDRFSELSNMFAQAGNLERALEYALRCADIEKQVAGKEHIWYGNSTIIIGNLYYALGDSINAEENYLINKNICKHTYGEYSERYVDALLSLASVNTDFSMKDGLDKATRYLDEAYSIAHKRYPLLEAQIVNQQSVIAFRNKNYEQAKTLMMQALSLCELAEGKTSNNYEILLSNTIDLYQMFGQYDEAITLGQDFLEACNQANRSDSIPAFIMVKISQANIAKGDINNALIQIEKAENIMRQYGTAKVDYINILGIMSTIYSNAGNKQKAISLNSKVLEFYEKKIWDNLLGDTPSKTNIYFSPEGIFHLLGIEYLCFDRPDCKIFRLSSTRRLCEDRGTASKPSLLLLGGLNYNDDSAVIQHPDTLPDRSASEILGRDMLPPVVGQGYTYLNGSLAEVNKIRTLISPNSCQLYQYSKGTEDIVKQDMQKYNMIHISTHGFCFDYQIVPSTLYLKDNVSEDLSLSRCGIILSGANRTAKQDANNKYVEDGILTARELCNLNLTHVELAVLSACQTGLGRITADGIAGLPRGLKKAGANAILVSLWDVNDHATQLLMTQFYRNLLKGKNKIESLHDAQTYVRNYEIEVETGVGKQQWKSRVRQEIDKTKEKSASPQTTKIKKYQDPYYWAAFFLIDAI